MESYERISTKNGGDSAAAIITAEQQQQSSSGGSSASSLSPLCGSGSQQASMMVSCSCNVM